jgi:hypothetical protein
MLSRNYIHISSRRERRSQCSITCRCFRHRKTLLMRPVNTSSSDELERMIVLAGQGRQCSTSLLIFAALSFPTRSSFLCCSVGISKAILRSPSKHLVRSLVLQDPYPTLYPSSSLPSLCPVGLVVGWTRNSCTGSIMDVTNNVLR